MNSHGISVSGIASTTEYLLYPDDLRDILESLRGELLEPEEVLMILLDGGIELEYLSTKYKTDLGPKNLFLLVLCQDTLVIDYDDLQQRCDHNEDLLNHVTEQVRDELLEARAHLGIAYEDSPYMAMEWAVRTARATSVVQEFEHTESVLRDILRENGKWKSMEAGSSQLLRDDDQVINPAREDPTPIGVVDFPEDVSHGVTPLNMAETPELGTAIPIRVRVAERSVTFSGETPQNVNEAIPVPGPSTGVGVENSTRPVRKQIRELLPFVKRVLDSEQELENKVVGLAYVLKENCCNKGYRLLHIQDGWEILPPETGT